MADRMKGLDEAILAWLLDPADPSVRYFTLTSLLGRGESAPEVVSARKAIMETGPVPRILSFLNDDGYWGEPRRFYTDKYGGTVWQLLVLAELGADGADPRIRKACEYVLGVSQDPDSGGFSVEESARTPGGRPSVVIPCLTGNLVWSLRMLGLGGDPRVRAAMDWIVRYQRYDDGAADPPRGWPYDRYEMCWGCHSCHMGVVKALKALSSIPAGERDAATEDSIRRGVEYVLAHHVHLKSHDLAAVSRPGWLKFGFPLMYQTDVLEILWILAELGIRDPRLGEALDAVREAEGPDGRWTMKNSFNGKMPVDIEKKGKPSKWITLRALRVLGAGC